MKPEAQGTASSSAIGTLTLALCVTTLVLACLVWSAVTSVEQVEDLQRRDLRIEAASATLFSGEYDRQKRTYAAGMDDLNTALKQLVRGAVEGEIRRARIVLMISALALPLLLTCWLIALRTMNRWKAALMRNHERLSRQSAELTQLNADLDQKVAERTGKLERAREEALHNLHDAQQARSKAEAAETRYRQIVDHAADIIYRTDAAGHVTFCNPIALRLMRYREREMMGIHFTELVRPDSRERIARFYGRQFVKQIPTSYCEVPAVANDGTELWLGQNVQLIVENADVVGFEVVARDITELRRAEDALHKSEERFRCLLEKTPDLVSIVDDQGAYLYVNPAHEAATGFSLADLVGRKAFEFLHPDDARALAPKLSEALRNGATTMTVEFRLRHKDGSFRDVEEIAVNLLGDPAVAGILLNGRDITERKRMQEQLTVQATALAAAANGIVITGTDGQIIWVNPAFTQLTGYSSEEVLGRNPRLLKSGKQDPGVYALLWRTILAGEVWTGEIVNRRKDGTLYNEEMTITPVRQHGVITHFIAIKRDVSERKRFEERLQVAKQAAEAANHAKSDFLANMSHEIRTPMNGIIGMTDLALGTPLAPEQREYLEMVKVSADSLMSVINDILDFSKIEAGKLELDPIDFNLFNVLGDAMKMQALRAHQKGLELTWRVLPDVPENLVGDPGRLRQILVNLVGNAIKFTEHGEVAVEVERANASAHRGSPHTERTSLSDRKSELAAPGPIQLRVTVRDTGIGIAADKQRTIFEPFEQADGSTTRKYGGTGLGLAISRRLINLMGGDFEVDSVVGQGSSFHFTASFGMAAAAAVSLPALLRNLRVLVVDDNATNRLILKETLLRWQMHPVTVDSGTAALATLDEAEHAGHGFVLVLLDEQMPGMDGFTLAERVGQSGLQRPPALIMLTSGGQAGDAARCRALGIAAHLMKPIKPSDLFDAIVRTMQPSGQQMDRPAEGDSRAFAAGLDTHEHLHILLAEDNRVNQCLAVRLLEKRGYTVVLANNGAEALAAFRREPFDAVLMDVQMPVMDGFEATAEIRRDENQPTRTGIADQAQAVRCDADTSIQVNPCVSETSLHIPIIAMTAHAMTGDRERCMAAGMDGYVSKPIRAKELLEVIEQLVRRSWDAKAELVGTSVAPSPDNGGFA